MFWYGHDFGPWGWAGMTLGMIVFWTLVVVGIAWLVRDAGRNRPPEGARPDPQQVLAERFARGEIDEPEYHDRLAVLRGQMTGTAPR